MVNAEPEIFQDLKLPRPLCPRVASAGTFECSCGFKFENHYSLTVHRNEHTRVTTHVRPSLSIRKLDRPMILSRPAPNQMLADYASHSCSYCDKTFTTVQGLHQHEGKMHTQKRKVTKCPVCHQKYGNKYAVKFHLQQVHSQAHRVHCEFCKLPFYNKYVYEKHIPKCPERIKLRDAYCE